MFGCRFAECRCLSLCLQSQSFRGIAIVLANCQLSRSMSFMYEVGPPTDEWGEPQPRPLM